MSTRPPSRNRVPYLRRWWRQGPASSAIVVLLLPWIVVPFVFLLLVLLKAIIGR
jgi:hypothetical protein